MANYIIPMREGDDPGQALAGFQKAMDADLHNQPDHLQKAARFAEFAVGWELPADREKSLMQVPPFVGTGGLLWAASDLSRRIEIVKGLGAGPHHALKEDICDVLVWWPGVKLWLTGWQRQVNSGQCWNLPGRFGEMADSLLDLGALLHAPDKVGGWWGQMYPTRDEVPSGEPGSVDCVRQAMGQRYCDWLIEETKPA